MARAKADILVINAAELVTLGGPKGPRTGTGMRKLGIIENGAVAIRGGKIIAVGDTEKITKRFVAPNGTTINASNKTVMPGFVDAHTHLIFSGSRENELSMKLSGKTYMEILKSGGGIMNTVRATRRASTEQLINEARPRVKRMLAHGTTSAEAKSGYGLEKSSELRSLTAIRALNLFQPVSLVPTFMGAHAIPPEFSNGDDYISHIIRDILPMASRRAKYCDVFCERGVFTTVQAKRLLNSARKNGMGIKLHVDEFVDTGGAGLAAQLGAVSAEHLLHSSCSGIRQMAKKGVIGVLLPVSAFSMMKGQYAHARMMIDEGLPIALGTDLCPNSWSESMQFVIWLACYKMSMTPAEAITAATINSAYSIGIGNTTGSLEIGKNADIIILDVPNHLQLVYRLGVNLVQSVIKDGKMVFENAHC